MEAGHYDRQIVEGMVKNQPPPSSAATSDSMEDQKKRRLVSARDARRYLCLSSLYLQKYVSVFRLPMTKNLMKMDIPNPSANRTFGAGMLANAIGNLAMVLNKNIRLTLQPGTSSGYGLRTRQFSIFGLASGCKSVQCGQTSKYILDPKVSNERYRYT